MRELERIELSWGQHLFCRARRNGEPGACDLRRADFSGLFGKNWQNRARRRGEDGWKKLAFWAEREIASGWVCLSLVLVRSFAKLTLESKLGSRGRRLDLYGVGDLPSTIHHHLFASKMLGSAVASSSRTLLRASRPALRPSIRSLSSTSTLRNAAPVDAKISGIVDQIEKLTLLEASDLVSALKTRLNITEIAMPAASAPAAAAPAAAEEVEEAAKPKEKTVFTLKLTGLKDPTAKAKVIREVKATNSNMCVSIISRAALSARSPISRLDEGSLWRKQCRRKGLMLTLSRRRVFDTGTWSRPRSSSSLHPRCSRRASTRKTPRSSRRPSRLPAALSSSSKSFAGLALIPSLSLSLSLFRRQEKRHSV